MNSPRTSQTFRSSYGPEVTLTACNSGRSYRTEVRLGGVCASCLRHPSFDNTRPRSRAVYLGTTVHEALEAHLLQQGEEETA